ncbi:MAG: ABC transporter ATP-binding protein [Pseudomonadota bacterium]
MIEIEKLTKYYRLFPGRRLVIDEADLFVPEPINLGILGRNGAGKSTLLRIIAGSAPYDSGRVVRHGRFSWPLGLKGMGGAMTGAENCDFVADIYGVDRKKMRSFVLEYSELGDFFFQPTRTYSSGMKARLSFGICMGVDFDVYLIDEGTATGDKRFQRRAREVFGTKLKHAKVIVVSHSDGALRKYCDHACVLEGGKVSEVMPLEDALKIHTANLERASAEIGQSDADEEAVREAMREQRGAV